MSGSQRWSSLSSCLPASCWRVSGRSGGGSDSGSAASGTSDRCCPCDDDVQKISRMPRRIFNAISVIAGACNQQISNMLGFEVDLIETVAPAEITELDSARRRDGRRLTATHPIRRRQPRHRQLRHRSGLDAMAGAQVHLGATCRDLAPHQSHPSVLRAKPGSARCWLARAAWRSTARMRASGPQPRRACAHIVRAQV